MHIRIGNEITKFLSPDALLIGPANVLDPAKCYSFLIT